MKTLIAESPVTPAFQWVEGHSVKKKTTTLHTPWNHEWPSRQTDRCCVPQIYSAAEDHWWQLFLWKALIKTQQKGGHMKVLQRNGQFNKRTNHSGILCKIWQDQQRKLLDSLTGQNEESHEKLPKDVSSVVNKERLGVLRHKQTNVILEFLMVCHVSVMRKPRL